ncbi:DNA-binding SARP family transcriptional activator [Motilibacter peucedani]|uniref:DNA-binding SARP family transcriptional activator n=1 Tax=Motilibacter peucedani TaxID=598650 RepID=A0A420XTR7_9ACTN|nr:DNA-binding SARP family transcriptional activator [Motilibacter peucedani]
MLGAVQAFRGGSEVALGGPRHRELLARLVLARGRVVPVDRLVADFWGEEPAGDPVAALRTFVAALRRALEPERAPRSRPSLLVTEGAGYAVRAVAVDAWRFEAAVAAAARAVPEASLQLSEEALALWRGAAYVDREWARAERARLAELRLQAVELRGGALLSLGRPREAVADLRAHVSEHPWREEGWRLLTLSLAGSGRRAEALEAVRLARGTLADELGLDPGPALRALEDDLLRRPDELAPDPVQQLWERATSTYARTAAPGPRARLESTVGVLRSLAVTGGPGLLAAREQRAAVVAAADSLGDPVLTARVIGAYDVPAVWTTLDDPEQARRVVAAAERALRELPVSAPPSLRARLLATVGVETRGTTSARGPQAARLAVELARGLDDPAVLAFALNAQLLHATSPAGRSAERDALGAELIEVSSRHALEGFLALGHLARMQARSAVGDFAAADRHAAAADALAGSHERPLVRVFTGFYRALRLAVGGSVPEATAAYDAVLANLPSSGMPGLATGLAPLVRLSLTVRSGAAVGLDGEWGPYEPWVRPLLLARSGGDAPGALASVPDPPPGLLLEAVWALVGLAACEVGDAAAAGRAMDALGPASGELAGAGSGLITLGPVSDLLARLRATAGG